MLGDVGAAISDELGVARDDLSTVVTHLLLVVGVEAEAGQAAVGVHTRGTTVGD